VTRRFALIVNPVAGGGRSLKAAGRVREELEGAGEQVRLIETASQEHAREVAAEAGRAGDTVVAVGGDGLVGTIAGELCESSSRLALVPAGRGNDFARVLRVPRDPRRAAEVARDGRERLLDVGEVDGASFVGNASLGIDSDVNQLANDTKFVRGNLVYLYATLRILPRWRHASFEVLVDGREHRLRGFTVAAANSGVYGGGMRVAPNARLDDGRLDVVMVSEHSKARFLLKGIPKLFRGSHLDDEAIGFDRGESVEVRADRPFTVFADGEPIARLPVTIKVRTRCLRVLVPRAEA
jgi:YegS/Rv2252/BmrU family lipid kinase